MTATKFIRNLLQLKELFVYDFLIDKKDKTLYLWVKPYKNGCRCPICNKRGKIVRQYDHSREWTDLQVYGYKVKLLYFPKEIHCPKHGRIQENIPWADTYARITYRFEYAMLVYCQIMTQKAAAYLLHISTSTLSDLLHRTIERIREGHRIRGLKSVGIDEIAYEKGKKYATVVCDLDRSCVVWVARGKGRKTIDRFFDNELSKYQKKNIKWAACDMSRAYIGAVEHHCPNATLVLDRFHIVKALNEAVDEVRKEEWRKMPDKFRKAFKGIRWLLFMHASKRSPDDDTVIDNLRKGNRRIHRAWVLKDEFEKFWDLSSTEKAETFLKKWGTTALKSRLEPIRKFVRTIRKHLHRILPYVETRLTNSISEGINRIIKIIKNRASGFRSFQAFTDIIFLVIGDVDIPRQIPANFHTL
jgi:transposase